MPRLRPPMIAFVLLGLVVVIRTGLLMAMALGPDERARVPDSMTYQAPALALLELGRYAESAQPQAAPELVRTPGYPLLIAGVWGAVGRSQFALLLAQSLLDALTIMLIYLLGRMLWYREAGLAAAILYALNMNSYHHTSLVLSESAFNFLLVLALLMGCRLLLHKDMGIKGATGLGLTSALATLVRPVLYYWMVPAVLGLLAIGWRRGLRGRALLIAPLGLILPWLILIGGWQLRNAAESGDATFSQIQNVNIYAWRAADVVARRQGISFDEAQRRLRELAEEGTQGLRPSARFAWMREQGLAILREAPALALRSQADGLLKLLAAPVAIDHYLRLGGRLDGPGGPLSSLARLAPGEYLSQWVRPHPLLFAMLGFELALMALVYAGWVAGLVMLGRRAVAPEHLLLLGTLAYLIVVSAGPEAYARLRVPLEPFWVLYAGLALTRGLKMVRGMARRRVKRNLKDQGVSVETEGADGWGRGRCGGGRTQRTLARDRRSG